MLPIPIHPSRPHDQLYLLTVQSKGIREDVYVMAMSVETAFDRYLHKIENRKETTTGVRLVQGRLANPRGI